MTPAPVTRRDPGAGETPAVPGTGLPAAGRVVSADGGWMADGVLRLGRPPPLPLPRACGRGVIGEAPTPCPSAPPPRVRERGVTPVPEITCPSPSPARAGEGRQQQVYRRHD